MKQQVLRRLTAPALILSAAALLIMPDVSIAAAKEGINLCLEVVVPSLFPFLVLSSLIISTGLADALGKLLQAPLATAFHLSSGCGAAVAAGLVGGFPVGARTAAQLYHNGLCSKDEAERLLAFCNNCGPAFVFGFAGGAVLGDTQAGLLLYLSQVMGALVTGIVLRGPENAKCIVTMQERTTAAGGFTAAVRGAFSSILDICAFVLFFSIAGGIFDACGLFKMVCAALSRFGIPAEVANAALRGLLEVSSGVAVVGSISAPRWLRLALCAAIMGWSGISVHCQVRAVIDGTGLDGRYYLKGKCIGCAVSCITAAIMGILFSPDNSYTPHGPWLHTAAAAACVALPLILIIIGAKDKNRAGNSAQNEV